MVNQEMTIKNKRRSKLQKQKKQKLTEIKKIKSKIWFNERRFP